MAEAVVGELRDSVGKGHPLEAIELIPSRGGVFDVFLDDELIFSKHKVHRHAVPSEIAAAVKKRVP